MIKNMPSIMKFGEPSLNERMALFESTGIDLGKNAAEKALAEWGGNREEITHIITYSNSGIPCPGKAFFHFCHLNVAVIFFPIFLQD